MPNFLKKIIQATLLFVGIVAVLAAFAALIGLVYFFDHVRFVVPL